MDNKQQNEVTWSNELVRDNANKDAKRELDTNANWRRLVKPKTMKRVWPPGGQIRAPLLTKRLLPQEKNAFHEIF